MYLIDVPPPTISGRLHMGHLFSYAHMDFMARWKKLKGCELVYPFCFDNNGLPTERLALADGKPDPKAYSLEVAEKYRDFFDTANFRWEGGEYYTYSDMAVEMAYKSFHDLKAKGLCYKGESEYFFCPETGTSVAESEIDEKGRWERTGKPVERRKGEGWFIRMIDHIPRIEEAVNRIEWRPEHFKKRLINWLHQMKLDWSISRERKYGIPIPGDEKYTFDTWFVSSLTPQLAWAAKTGKCELSCPIFDARFQGHDIIRTWALFTIVKSLYHNDQIPWHNIVISGHALGKENQKMSKSAGNATSPTEYLEKYGAAGPRYWAGLCQLGTDTKVDEAAMSKGRKLVNKLKNAGRFLGMNQMVGESSELENEWKFAKRKIGDYMDNYQWPEALHVLYAFFWSRYCDHWIEQSKKEPINMTLAEVYAELADYFRVFIGDF